MATGSFKAGPATRVVIRCVVYYVILIGAGVLEFGGATNKFGGGNGLFINSGIVRLNLTGTATVQVNVDKQPGEVKTSNNSYSYKIANKL